MLFFFLFYFVVVIFFVWLIMRTTIYNKNLERALTMKCKEIQ